MSVDAERKAMVAALYVRDRSVYAELPGVDPWPRLRDASKWPGGTPAVAHPPCAQWCKLRHFARRDEEQRRLAVIAVRQVRANGGVLEHPAYSRLWVEMDLPLPGAPADLFGGWTFAVSQKWFGHRAEKLTWLYVVGCNPTDLPPFPIVLGDAAAVCKSNSQRATRVAKHRPRRPSMWRKEREETPRAFAEWLVEITRTASNGR